LNDFHGGFTRYLTRYSLQTRRPTRASEYENTSIALQISSLRALSALINACPERMPYWKGTILNGVARCWVGTVDSLDPGEPPDHNNNPQLIQKLAPNDLKRELKNVCRTLADAYNFIGFASSFSCPSFSGGVPSILGC
jgi:hypothetical protein